MISKTLFNYCKKHLRLVEKTQLKANATLTHLVDRYNVGSICDGIFYFNEKDKAHLTELIAQQLDGLRLSDDYPVAKSRTELAKQQRNEKLGALNISDDFVLVNSLNTLNINHQVVDRLSLSSLGQLLSASQISSIQHQQIILVENLIVMANLDRLNIPSQLKNALWLYRGDAQKHQQTSTACQLYKRFQRTHNLICFSDFDPAGLQIALTCGASQWLTLKTKLDLNIQLSGNEFEWFNQDLAIKYINNHKAIAEPIKGLFNEMNIHQKTLKQEHMLAHDLPLVCYELT